MVSVILSVMPTVTIYVPAMKLKVIDLYCTEHKIARGTLLANCAMSFLNSRSQRAVLCDKCKRNPAFGKYHVTIYDFDTGERNMDMNLCERCHTIAKKEGVVKDAE